MMAPLSPAGQSTMYVYITPGLAVVPDSSPPSASLTVLKCVPYSVCLVELWVILSDANAQTIPTVCIFCLGHNQSNIVTYFIHPIVCPQDFKMVFFITFSAPINSPLIHRELII